MAGLPLLLLLFGSLMSCLYWFGWGTVFPHRPIRQGHFPGNSWSGFHHILLRGRFPNPSVQASVPRCVERHFSQPQTVGGEKPSVCVQQPAASSSFNYALCMVRCIHSLFPPTLSLLWGRQCMSVPSPVLHQPFLLPEKWNGSFLACI